MRNILIAIAILTLAGCTANIRMTDINMEAGGDMYVDASGATNRTDTGLATDADLSELVDVAKDALKGKASGIIDTVKDVLGGGADDPEPIAVSPPAGTIEEVD